MINDIDKFGEAFKKAFDCANPFINQMDEKNEIHNLLKNGIEAMTKNDLEGIEAFEKNINKLGDKMNNKYSQ